MAIPTAPYNITKAAGVTGYGNDTGMLTMVQGVNDVLFGGWFGLLFLAAIFMVLLMSFYTSSSSASRAFTSALFICFSLSIPLVGLNLLATSHMVFILIATTFSLVITFFAS